MTSKLDKQRILEILNSQNSINRKPMQHNKKPFLVWDVCQITQDELNYRLTESDNECDELEDGETEDERKERIKRDLWNDSDYIAFEWDSEMDYLTDVMKTMNPGGYWRCNVNNFGWQHLDGSKMLKAETGEELLRSVLPDTECTFSMYRARNGKGIVINNAHHDAPMGGEMYYIRPMSANRYSSY